MAGCVANPKAGSVGGIEAVRESGFDFGCILEVRGSGVRGTGNGTRKCKFDAAMLH